MTTVASSPSSSPNPDPEHGGGSPGTVGRQALALARRSVLSTIREPTTYIPSLMFPLLIAAVNSAALTRATDLPGWPVGPDGEPVSFLTFVLPATIVQAVLLGAITGGADIARDIQNGFFERLLASPVARISILVGRLSGAALVAGLQSLVIMAIFWVFGVRIEAGSAGVLVIFTTAVLLGIAIGGVAAAIGLRTGLEEAVNSAFPLVFIVLFISSAFFPTGLMEGWYQALAEHNPLSWIINGMRYQVITGFDGLEALQAVGVTAALAVATVLIAVTQLRRRLKVAS